MATLTGTLTDASKTAIGGAPIFAELVDPATGEPRLGQLPSGETVARWATVTSAEDGAWSLDLPASDEYVWPTGTGYRVTFPTGKAVIVQKGSGSETMETVVVLDATADPATPAAIDSLRQELPGLIEDAVDGLDLEDDGAVARDGSRAPVADLSMGGHRLTGLGAPADPDDAVRKTDVDDLDAADVGADPAGTAAGLVGGLTAGDVGADPAGTAQGLVDSLDATDVGAIPETDRLSLAAPNRPGGFPIKRNLDSYQAALDQAHTTPVDVVVLSDSTAALGAGSWPYQVNRYVGSAAGAAQGYGATSYREQAVGTWRGAGGQTIPAMDSQDGTLTASATGMLGATMDPGDKATVTFTCDGVSVVYSTSPGSTGQLTVRNGAGGTVLAAIDTDGPDKAGQVWTSSALTRQSRTIELENTGSDPVVVELVYQHDGNRDAGVRVWNAAKSGNTTASYLDDPRTGLDLIETLQPAAVIIGTGINDTLENIGTRLANLVAAVRQVAPDTCIIGLPPYVNAHHSEAEAAAARAALEPSVDLLVDLTEVVPRALQQGLVADDGVHPGLLLTERIAFTVASLLAGDPFTVSYAMLQNRLSVENPVLYGNLTFYGTNGPVLHVPSPSSPRINFTSPLMAAFGQPPAGHVALGWLDVAQQSEPAAPTSGATLFVRNNAGSRELCVKFANGTVEVLTADT